jgi:hypothetical protein
MQKLRLLVLVLFFAQGITSCNFKSHVKSDSDEKIAVHPFLIDIHLTDLAANKLKKSGESIKGTVYFDGDGTPLPKGKSAPFRNVYLGKVEFETKGAGIVSINNAYISKKAHFRLTDKNYHFTINISSGRRVLKNNILSCRSPHGRLKDLEKNKVIKILCELL